MSRFERAGLRVVASRMEHLTVEMAKDSLWSICVEMAKA